MTMMTMNPTWGKSYHCSCVLCVDFMEGLLVWLVDAATKLQRKSEGERDIIFTGVMHVRIGPARKLECAVFRVTGCKNKSRINGDEY